MTQPNQYTYKTKPGRPSKIVSAKIVPNINAWLNEETKSKYKNEHPVKSAP